MRAKTWHEAAATPEALRAARRLASGLPADGFYLAGGTGLSLQLGHRISVDLDLFSASVRLDEPGRRSLLARLQGEGPVEIDESREGTLHLLIEGAAVSLLRYPYPLLKETRLWRPAGGSGAGLRVASLEDIGLMKAAAIVGRGSKKDFVDLRAIVRKIPLERLLRRAEEKFPDHRDFLVQAAKAFVYFEDAEREAMPRLLAPCDWEEVKGYFERTAPRILRKLLD